MKTLDELRAEESALVARYTEKMREEHRVFMKRLIPSLLLLGLLLIALYFVDRYTDKLLREYVDGQRAAIRAGK